ncbi:MAG: rod shape-determining protein MreC [Bacteroidales bacterium]|nr:rod shape-determining protein MreC [Bacteroidales bacterium]
MRNLLNFLAKYNNLIIFLILEGVALSLLFSGNSYHNTRLVKGVKGLTKGIEEKIYNIRTYLDLREINLSLASENTALRNQMGRLLKEGNVLFFSVTDSLFGQKYQFTPAEVIGNSVNRQKNYLTLSKGKKHGIEPDMAVTNSDGIIGVVVGSSRNFSIAMSLLNLDFRLSARIKSNGYFGSLTWEGRDYRHVILSEIPQHVVVNKGDTIETTGYSAVFPEGIMIGTVSDISRSGSDFYKITISLVADFKKLHFVNIVGNMKKTEQLELENLFQ